jgi:polysaccharide export outer membrane protein
MMRDGGRYRCPTVRRAFGRRIETLPANARSRPDRFNRRIAIVANATPLKIPNAPRQYLARAMFGWRYTVSLALPMSNCLSFGSSDMRNWNSALAATSERRTMLPRRIVTGPQALGRFRLSLGSSGRQNERVSNMRAFPETSGSDPTPIGYWCAVLTCCFTLSGCDGGAAVASITPEEQQALIQSASTLSPNLQPGDKIKVTVFGEDRLSGEYEIDSAGYVSLPLAGTVKVAGLSKLQMEQSLARKFSGEYLRDPKVTVDIGSFRPFYIMGEVAKPGEYLFKNGLNVLSAIALAGGSTYRASRGAVQIQHVGEAEFKSYPMSPTIPVLPGDLIRIPERYF